MDKHVITTVIVSLCFMITLLGGSSAIDKIVNNDLELTTAQQVLIKLSLPFGVLFILLMVWGDKLWK